jgi:hypothetical protein
MTRIHVVDTIGRHAGMRRYDEAVHALLVAGGFEARLVSNFDGPDTAPCLIDFYRGNLARKLGGLALSFMRFVGYRFARAGGNDWWIYSSYGMRSIDALFLLPLLTARSRAILLIHDVYSLTSPDSPRLLRLKNFVYRRLVLHVIVQSDKARTEVVATGFRGSLIEIPLVRARSRLQGDTGTLADEVGRLQRRRLS